MTGPTARGSLAPPDGGVAATGATEAGASGAATGRTARPAIVLFSGGLDSTTALAIARAEGWAVHALSFDYGQRHQHELAAARRIGAAWGIEHHVIAKIDLRVFGGSALTADIPVPKDRERPAIGDGVPITYVPARNTIFLSFALAWAEVLGAADLFIGVNALDYSGYPDCRPEFIAAFEHLANVATVAGVEGRMRLRVHAPLLYLTKAEIIRRGVGLGVDYSLTMTCYDPAADGLACGRCDACQLRAEGFRAAGIPDPTRYVGG